MAPSLTPRQRQIAAAINKVGLRRGASYKERVAAIETGLTESNLSNPNHGDGTSKGWRQETASSYPSVNRLDVRGAARRFFSETRPLRGKYARAGDLAQAVQRSAYPDRYNQRAGEAKQIVNTLGGGGATVGHVATKPAPSGGRRAALLNYLQNDHQPDALLTLATSLKNAVERTPGKPIPTPGGGPGLTGIEARANRISSEHLPYQWGGGHGATPAGPGVPLDCSGAVSRLLKVNPRVSGQFAKWGAPGQGRHVTVYANGTHVFVEINGHFWGTSHANPGGGAGWIPRSQMNAAYLSRFTRRHPPGL